VQISVNGADVWICRTSVLLHNCMFKFYFPTDWDLPFCRSGRMSHKLCSSSKQLYSSQCFCAVFIWSI